jgi:hypothetical protein
MRTFLISTMDPLYETLEVKFVRPVLKLVAQTTYVEGGHTAVLLWGSVQETWDVVFSRMRAFPHCYNASSAGFNTRLTNINSEESVK